MGRKRRSKSISDVSPAVPMNTLTLEMEMDTLLRSTMSTEVKQSTFIESEMDKVLEVKHHHDLSSAAVRTGVIYATHRAAEKGYTATDKAWANLGQGAPETGELPGAPERPTSVIQLDEIVNEYAPVGGEPQLRQAVADYYNNQRHSSARSMYTSDNVAIVGGGRMAIVRSLAALGSAQIGYIRPDYSAYQQAIEMMSGLRPIPLMSRSHHRTLDPEELQSYIQGMGLHAILLSNPCNPTGTVIHGERLESYLMMARVMNCTMIMDEFYSHYVYSQKQERMKTMTMDSGESTSELDIEMPLVSAAQYVREVEADPVLIINGLTKNWRLPGWRIAWVVGPSFLIERIISIGSYLDGGASHPLQRAAIPLLDRTFVAADTRVLRAHFLKKRNYLIKELRSLGIRMFKRPQATFYIWAFIGELPSPINNCLCFFESLLDFKAICVPGIFFDINPGHNRNLRSSVFMKYVRFSYGPPMETLKLGVNAIKKVVELAKNS